MERYSTLSFKKKNGFCMMMAFKKVHFDRKFRFSSVFLTAILTERATQRLFQPYSTVLTLQWLIKILQNNFFQIGGIFMVPDYKQNMSFEKNCSVFQIFLNLCILDNARELHFIIIRMQEFNNFIRQGMGKILSKTRSN